MIVDVHESDAVFGSFRSGVWDEPLLDGVPVKQAFYADEERGIIRTYDLGDGEIHSTREQIAVPAGAQIMGELYWRELRGAVQLRRLSERG